jgi:hypothetical protein
MAIIDQQEDENNWDRLERAFFVLASVVRGGAYKLEADFVPGLKIIARATSNAVRLASDTRFLYSFSTTWIY